MENILQISVEMYFLKYSEFQAMSFEFSINLYARTVFYVFRLLIMKLNTTDDPNV